MSERFGVTDEVTVTQVASALLDRGAPEGRHYYSHISSFAHAEVDSINMFLTPGNLSTPELALRYAVEWAGMCIGTSIIIGRDIVEFFGVDGAVLQQWNAAIESALTALELLRRAGRQPRTAEEE